MSGAKKKPLGPPSRPVEKKRKLDTPDNSEKKLDIEKKTTGIALLGSYEDDSDEDWRRWGLVIAEEEEREDEDEGEEDRSN